QRLRRALRATMPTPTPSPRRRPDRISAAMQRALRMPPTAAERSELVQQPGSVHRSIAGALRPAVPTPAQPSTPTPPAISSDTATAAAAPVPDPDPEINHYLDNAGLVLL